MRKLLFKEWRVLALSTAFGMVAWIFDAGLDYFIFYKYLGGTFWEILIIRVPAHEAYIRVTILVLFILFGVLTAGLMAKRKEAEFALKKAKGELEIRVAERTVELHEANTRLQQKLEECTLVEESLRESEQQLRHLSFQTLTAQETERRRISRELHDEFGGALAVFKLRLGYIEKNLPADQIRLKEECTQNRQYLDQVIDNMNRLSRDLSPSILEDHGLTAALRWLVNSFNKNSEIRLTGELEPVDDCFSPGSQMMIYRVLQEAIANVWKHAQAKNVSVSTRLQDGRVSFVVQDDGKGFDVLKAASRRPEEKGLGLATMKERARILGGSFHLQSREGDGTCLTLNVPKERGAHS
jgi:signal transduction histidine kinase